jgi:cholesterol transport system auxiliary component
MKIHHRVTVILLISGIGSLFLGLFAGCTAGKGIPQTLYDLGPEPVAIAAANPPATENPAARQTRLRPMRIADINAPPWLDNHNMFYRLDYSNKQQLLSYANSSWSMPPAQLLGQRVKTRLTHAGATVLSMADGAVNVPLLLRIEVEDFTQVFDSPAQSKASINLRASLFDGRNLLSQKTFSTRASAPSADASGGAKALAQAGDIVIHDILRWLQELETRQ